MPKIFQDIKGFIIPLKLSEYEMGVYTHLIDKNGI